MGSNVRQCLYTVPALGAAWGDSRARRPLSLLWAEDAAWAEGRACAVPIGQGRESTGVTSSGPDTVEEEVLVRRARGGDPDRFADLFERHRADLRRLCQRLLVDPSAVDDALADIFLRAHRAFPQYEPQKPFKPWLRTLASNHCIDQLRRRRTERGLFEPVDATGEIGPDDAPGALIQITQREDRRAVLEALDALPPKYRIPLVLRFYRDFDYEAIASTLGTSKNQVSTLLFRGKQRLRQALLERSEGTAASASRDSTRHRSGQGRSDHA